MIGFGAILSIVGGVSKAVNIYKFGSTLAKGDDAGRVLGELGRLHAKVERLSDNILYAPGIEGLSPMAGAAHRLNGFREARALLEPVQAALGGEIVSSGLIETPERMERAMAANPWAVLENICPQHLAVRRPIPDKVPVLFVHQGVRYIGWQMRGALPMLFNCELRDLPGLGAPPVPDVLDKLPVPPIPAVARPAWASNAGQDKFGLWAEFALGGVRQRMRWIEPGTFTMGFPKGEDGRYPQQEVRLTKGFWLGDTPATQALWAAAMGNNPSYFKGQERPVEQVSWDDVQQFLQKVNGRIPELGLSFPRRLNGNMPAGRAPRGPITGPCVAVRNWRISLGLAITAAARRIRWPRSHAMRGGYTICSGTLTSGAPTGASAALPSLLPILLARWIAPLARCAAVTGATGTGARRWRISPGPLRSGTTALGSAAALEPTGGWMSAPGQARIPAMPRCFARGRSKTQWPPVC